MELEGSFVILAGLVFVFTYVNGFHDGCNVVATLIASRAMRPKMALAWAAVVELLSPFLILVLGASGVSYSSEADFEQYALLPGRRDIFVARIEANGSTDLNLYGKISPDFYGEYEFTVSPTLKISTVNAAD